MINLDTSGNTVLTYFKTKNEIRINDSDFTNDTKGFEDSTPLQIIIQKAQKKRSNKMNRYMWGEIIPKVAFGLRQLGNRLAAADLEPIAVEIMQSMTPEGAHEYLKGRFAAKETIDLETGEIKIIKPSTRSMTNQQMLQYFEPIIQWAADKLQIKINYPHEHENIPFDEWIKQSAND